MSLVKVFPRFQVVPALIRMTAFAGLPLFAGLAESVGLIPGLEERQHFLRRGELGFSVWQLVLSLMLLLMAGGESVSDVDVLQSDLSLKRLLGWPRLPSARSLGQFLDRCIRRALGALRTAMTRLASKSVQHRLSESVTLEFDAILMESQKQEAEYTDE